MDATIDENENLETVLAEMNGRSLFRHALIVTVFYMSSRSIPEHTARNELVAGFFEPVLKRSRSMHCAKTLDDLVIEVFVR